MKCQNCQRELVQNEIGLSIKYFGAPSRRYNCKTCLAEYFCTTEKYFDNMIKFYCDRQCSLFECKKIKNEKSETQ